MCFSVAVTAAMVAAGTVGTGVTLYRRDPLVVPLTLGWFTLMEGLQLFGYAVIDQCGTPANEVVTLLSVLHIAFQPLFINAFAMAVLAPVRADWLRILVYTLSALASAVIVLQIYPFSWAGDCAPGSILCGLDLCTVSGDWHLAWNVPLNGLAVGLDGAFGMGWGFPTYMVAAFGLPLLYGAWRFALFHALVGPVLAGTLTTNPNEVPAIWCLFSIGILMVALSPWFRRQLSVRPSLPARTGA